MASGQSDSVCKEGIIMTTPTVVRAGLFALAIVALGFVPEVSGANPASAPGSGDVTVSGNGDLTVNGKLLTFSFNATQKQGVVTGQAHFNFAGLVVTDIAIDCLNSPPLFPNTVVVSGTVTGSNLPNRIGLTGVFKAEDNSKVSTRPPDGLSVPAYVAQAPKYCQSGDFVTLPFQLTTHPLAHGNITITLGKAAGKKGNDEADDDEDDDEKGEHEGDHQGKYQGKHQGKHHHKADDD
jgi:hypothetical protein